MRWLNDAIAIWKQRAAKAAFSGKAQGNALPHAGTPASEAKEQKIASDAGVVRLIEGASMYRLPDLLLEDVAFKLSAGGLPVLCEIKDAAFLAEFSVGIDADTDGEWEISTIRMGDQVLPAASAMSRLIVSHVTENKSGYVHDHIAGHLQDAREAAEYEAKAPHFRGTLTYHEVA